MAETPRRPFALEGIDRESREILHGILAAMCLDGQCYELAIALHRGTGLPMFGLWSDECCGDDGVPGTWRHAAVMLPDGGFVDARGRVTARDLGAPFGPQHLAVRRISEADLTAVRPVREERIRTVAKLAQALWPDLPWKDTSFQGRMAAFLAGLEELSRKHRIWVRSPYPAARPMLAEGDGDEAGYAGGLTGDGMAVCFDRTFGR
jgi:hypothetical protein